MMKQLLSCIGLTVFSPVHSIAGTYSTALLADDNSDNADATEFRCTLHQGGTSGKAVELKSIFTGVNENDDGSFTIADFANSGTPVTVTVDDKADAVNGKYLTKIVGARITESPGDSYWIADAYVLDGNNLIDGKFFYEDETVLPVTYLCIILETEKESPLSYISSDGEGASSTWFCRMLVRPYSDNFSLEKDDFVEMTFTLPNAPRSGIEMIEAEELSDLPVEYFNLQGTKVDIDNAPAGIYIRRQGSSSEKVAVRK